MAAKKGWDILEIVKAVLLIMICVLAGVIGSRFTQTGPGSWHAQLNKPSFNPPNWLFGPVWTILYILMGLAVYHAIRSKAERSAIILFATQLVLNTLWTIIFFGLHNILLALIEMIVLWIAILFTIKEFYKKSKVAAYLMIPYILWVSFAAVLTLAIYVLN